MFGWTNITKITFQYGYTNFHSYWQYEIVFPHHLVLTLFWWFVIRRILYLSWKKCYQIIYVSLFIFTYWINGHMFSYRTEFALNEIMSSGGAEDDIPQGERKTVTDFCYLLDKSKQLFNGLRLVDSWCLKLFCIFFHGWYVVSFWKLWVDCFINTCIRGYHAFFFDTLDSQMKKQ